MSEARVASAGIIRGGVQTNKIMTPGYPGRYGMVSSTYDVLARAYSSGYRPVRGCPDCIGYPCECGTAGGGC